ncbi:MAG: GNAT family N-acetyltransferase [Beduini sp.]|uniref:GNAT family N-acetyltransferase n=1 Tax=Beduini sp. TaxID=1922300 RepID=UPI0039A0C543
MKYTIRPIQQGDEVGINRLRRMPGVFENILGIPSERLERNREGIENLGVNDHRFVAVSEDGEIIGDIGLSVEGSPRRRHCGTIGIMVDHRYQNQHIGSSLMEAALDIADNWLMLVRVELNVFVDNEKAINLYKKYGFEIEGTQRKASIRNGAYVDEYMMGRIKKS